MGGICWWIVPACLGSSAGLACRALLLNPASITYPNALSASEVDSGLPVIYGMAAIFGKSGAAAGLVMLFMSVTSATSAELIAFSSVTTYDIYRTYVNPAATGKQLVNAAHISVVGFSLFMAVLSVIFNYIGVTVGWLLSFIGIILSPEVSAVTMTLFWSKMSKKALLIGAPLGTLTGVGCWLGSTYVYGGHIINKATVMTSEATFIGNITALASTPIYIAILSYVLPDEVPFDLNHFRSDIKMGDDADQEESEAAVVDESEKKLLHKQAWWSLAINVFILLGCYVIIPTALYGSDHDLSKSSFSGLIIVFLIWLLLAALYIVILPLWQGRESLSYVFGHLIRLKFPENPNVPLATVVGSPEESSIEEVHLEGEKK
ncbi:hypothetical protein B5S30_g4165 [[Candida] boidinii]|nr:hypothetical protein B5S30_g4165 [[Candida] boidinii]